MGNGCKGCVHNSKYYNDNLDDGCGNTCDLDYHSRNNRWWAENDKITKPEHIENLCCSKQHKKK